MANTYSAGIVTAYGAAKKAGYTGTYEQFCAEQASFAQNAQQVRQDKESVEQTVTTFSNTTVPAAVQSVTDEGTAQVGLVTNAGTAAVGNVNDAGTTQVGNVNSAGQTQVGNVNDAGTTQVGNVQNEGARQVQAVEDKGAEVIASIPPDYTELSNAVYNDVTGLDTKAPVIRETASGAIASFSDGADSMPIKKLVAQIEPVQDLHGYDTPWPGGAGKNKFNDADPTLANWALNNGVFTNSVTDTRAYVSLSIQGRLNGEAVATFFTMTVNTTGRVSRTFNVNSEIDTLVIKHSGSTRDFNILFPFSGQGDYVFSADFTGVDPTTVGGVVMKECQIEAGSTVSTYEPYSNICPISGWTGAEVTRTGKNLLVNSGISGATNGVTFVVNQDFTVTANGTATGGNANFNIDFNYIPPGDYYFVGSPYGGSANTYHVYMWDVTTNARAKKWDSTTSSSNDTDGSFQQFKVEAGHSYRLICRILDGTSVSNLTFAPMICLNSITDTVYEPYQGESISVNWQSQAGTVYGGTLTLNPDRTGTLVVDKRLVDLGTLTWAKGTEATGQFYSETDFGALNSTDIICSEFRYGQAYAATEDNVIELRIGTYHRTWIRSTPYSGMTASEFKAAMSGVQLVYPLASPQTYQLAENPVDTLYGTNNIWTDVGTVDVEYPADTKLYIDGKITQAIAAALNA